MIPVLTFHALDERPSPLSVPPRVFARGLEHLHERGWRTLPLGEIATRLEAGKPLPERAIAITFDDGFRSVRDEGLPVLHALGYTATLFPTLGADDRAETMLPMGERPMLTWSQTRELREAGWEIGAHSRTHPDLTRLPSEQVEAEMRDSRAVLEERLGARVSAFAYPFGRHDRRTRAIARRHFACAWTTRLGRVGPRSDLYALERIDAHYLRTDRLFRLLASPALPWYLGARSVPRAARAALGAARGATRP